MRTQFVMMFNHLHHLFSLLHLHRSVCNFARFFEPHLPTSSSNFELPMKANECPMKELFDFQLASIFYQQCHKQLSSIIINPHSSNARYCCLAFYVLLVLEARRSGTRTGSLSARFASAGCIAKIELFNKLDRRARYR